jgi:hypothetical protein
MKNTIKRLFAFSLVLFLASVGQAAVTAHQPYALSQKKTVSGKVLSVDSAKKEVVIEGSDGAEYILVVNKSTKLTKGDKAISLADVKADEKVAVEATEAEGKLIARSIKVE